jgi:peptide/nickel transport system permease protein
VFPGVAIVLTVLGLTLMGESINDLNDPRLRGRKRAGGKGGPVSSPAGMQASIEAEVTGL